MCVCVYVFLPIENLLCAGPIEHARIRVCMCVCVYVFVYQTTTTVVSNVAFLIDFSFMRQRYHKLYFIFFRSFFLYFSPVSGWPVGRVIRWWSWVE